MASTFAALGSTKANLKRVKQWVTLATFSFPPIKSISFVIPSIELFESLAIKVSLLLEH